MIKRLVLASSLLLLVACGKEEPPNLVTVENAKVVNTSDKSCIRNCEWKITVKKGDTTLAMRTEWRIVEAVSIGNKVTIKYDPAELEIYSVTFPDFESKEVSK